MFASTLKQHFMVMGANVDVTVGGNRFELDVENNRLSETFKIRLPDDGSVTAKILDSDRRCRHLVLDVNHRQFGMNQKYLCGHDEFHWFVAALPETSKARTVPEAMEALKPKAVLTEQRRKRVKRQRRRNRRTTAYIRQGEWFFMPCPEFDVEQQRVIQNGTLVRGAGKPHHVEFLCRSKDGESYVRGKVRHPDHRTIYLEGWHKVLSNTENVSQNPLDARIQSKFRESLFHMNYVD